MKNENRNNPNISATDMEQDTGNAVKRQNALEKINSQARIHVHSRRYVPADSDGLCVKWVLDAIVSCGILKDDSLQWVESVTFSQEKISKHEPEITIITIETI